MNTHRCRQVLLVLAVSSLAAEAQSGAIAGRVTDEQGRSLAGVSVSLPGTGRGALVDSLGRFVVGGLDPRGYTLQARRPGFAVYEEAVTVRAGDTTFVDITLASTPQALATVRTEARTVDQEIFLARPSISTTTMSARSMQAVPRLGEPDIMRVVQMMPGVAAKNDFSTGFNVHGGEADQNLVLIDGYPIYNPFHLGGLFSTFIDATVREVSLMTGPYPARHGGRLSSVLDVRSAVEGRPGLHGSAEVSLLGVTGTLAAPIGTRGSWMLSARRTYADVVASTFTDNVLPYHFRDMQGHLTWTLPAGIRLAVTGYTGDDVLDANISEVAEDSTESAGGGDVRFRWGNAVLGATASRALPYALGADSVVLAQRVSRTRFSTDVDLADGAATLRNTVGDVRVAGDLTRHSESHTLVTGYEASFFTTLMVDGSPAAGIVGTNRRQRGNSLALFVDDTWRPSASSRWLLQGGLRAERVAEADWVGVSPRLAVKYFLRDDLALAVSTGRTTQWMHSLALEDSPIRFFDSYVASDSATPVASAWHGTVGLERWFGSSRQVRIEGFVKGYDRLVESDLTEDPLIDGDEFEPTTGFAYGIDLFVRQFETSDGRLSGWLSYTWAVTSRDQLGVRFAPGHDRRHNLNLVATWRAGRYVFGTRLGLASGTPYTEIVGQYVRRRFDPLTFSWENPGQPPYDVDWIGGTRNGERYPLTHRLDLSVSREYQRGRTTIRPYLSLVNAYNAKNVFAYVMEYGSVPPTRTTLSQFPILPSLGVSIAW